MRIYLGIVIFAIIFIYVVTDGFNKINLPI